MIIVPALCLEHLNRMPIIIKYSTYNLLKILTEFSSDFGENYSVMNISGQNSI
jgi:hypothetical protein